MLVQTLNVMIIVVVLTTITSVMIFTNLTVASSDDGRSIAPYYRDGYEVGKILGIEDHRYGNEHNDRCLSENATIFWCIGYEIGYNDGYYGSSEISDRSR